MTKATPAPPPYLPPKWDIPDAAAIQALVQGTATSEQQQRAIAWIINDACGSYDLEYRTDPRDHAFVSGRRFVGLEIIKMMKLQLSKFKK